MGSAKTNFLSVKSSSHTKKVSNTCPAPKAPNPSRLAPNQVLMCGPLLYPDCSCDYPSEYLIEPSSICHLKCPFCPQGKETKEMFPAKGMISLSNYRVILDKIACYAKRIEFFNWGEPYLNKNINAMVKLASERGIKTTISSNLSISGLDYEAIVTSGLTNLTVSIYGASQETYGKYRIGGDYHLVLRNMAGIEAAKKQLKSDQPKVRWQFLINKFNEHELDNARELARVMGIQIIFRLMNVPDKSWSSSLTNPEYALKYDKTSSKEEYLAANRSLPRRLTDVILHPEIPAIAGKYIKE